MKKILEVKIEQVLDEDPDLSFLGEYSNTEQEGAIETGREGSYFRYFIPAMTGEETGNPDSPQEDYERMEAYNRGEWHSMGIRASARIAINPGRPASQTQYSVLEDITTPGIWGVESDSGEDYVTELGGEQLEELKDLLGELGFAAAEIAEAFKEVKTEQ